ncbi:MAG: transposase [Syntrophobacteraceae bacterium]
MAGPETPKFTPICPRCGSDAAYRYGKTRQGRQRFWCLICERQFTDLKPKPELAERPVCRACGRKMHVYGRHLEVVRFRCSGYPHCRNYLKILKEHK